MKILPLIFFISFCYTLQAQLLELYGQRKDRTIDTLIFGFQEEGSVDIDAALGEFDLFSVPPLENEVRILQRTQTSFECLYSDISQTNPIYFNTNFDSKINIRNKDNAINTFFEFKVYGEDWIGFTIVGSSQEDLDTILDEMIVSYGGCFTHNYYVKITEDPNVNYYAWRIFPFELATGNDYYVTNFTIVLKKDIINSTLNDTNSSINIYPNPATDFLHIDNNSGSIIELRIFDILGNLVLKEQVVSSMVDISSLYGGSYFLNVVERGNSIYKGQLLVRD